MSKISISYQTAKKNGIASRIAQHWLNTTKIGTRKVKDETLTLWMNGDIHLLIEDKAFHDIFKEKKLDEEEARIATY